MFFFKQKTAYDMRISDWTSDVCSSDLSGNLLLAMPGIGDPNFEKSVIALCAHDENGAMGINIGQEIPGLSLRELLTQFDLSGDKRPDVPILRGGPVEPQRGFVLHTLDWGGQDRKSTRLNSSH